MNAYEIEKRIRKQARTEGRAEGRVEGKTDAVLTLLKAKGTVPPQVEAAVRGQTDIDVLGRWLLLAIDVKNVEEFQGRLESVI